VRGCVWRRTVSRRDAEPLAARHEVLSRKLAAGHSVLRVFSDTHPGDGFAAAEPDLEDVYFHRLAAPRRRDAATPDHGRHQCPGPPHRRRIAAGPIRHTFPVESAEVRPHCDKMQG